MEARPKTNSVEHVVDVAFGKIERLALTLEDGLVFKDQSDREVRSPV